MWYSEAHIWNNLNICKKSSKHLILGSRTSISTTVTFLVHIDPKIGNMQSYDERLMNKDRSNFFDYLGNLYFGTYQQTINFKSSLNLLANGIWRISKKYLF